MFPVIRANVTSQQVEEMYPNHYSILYTTIDCDSSDRGDLIFIGTEDELCEFGENNQPDDGYAFYWIEGHNFKRYAPMIEAC